MNSVDRLLRFRRIPTNGITLHVAEAGAPEGPLLFLLHGFPEFWYGWRNQIPALAERGFHVVVPDQRGYNLSDKPTGVANYDLDHLAADIVGLADHFGRETFSVVGHDWGASVSWWIAARFSRRVARLAVLNAPHPAVWVDAMNNDPDQKRKSFYVRFFGIRYLPEWLIGLNRSKALGKGFNDSIRAGAFTEEDFRRYGEAWSQPGTLTAMINYYRALLNKRLLAPSKYQVSTPALVIWGKRDAYAIPELAKRSAELCTDSRVVYLDQATHWVHHDEPHRVAQLLTEFLDG
jgi:pimeloyl-ACP methyl ester carboxylesterase